MADIPYLVVARREHDFRVVETSPSFPYREPVVAEARWFALDWWGSCFVQEFRGALGHVPSKARADLYQLMLVLPGPVAPDRFVVCLSTAEYRGYGFNPFRAAQAGVFDIAERFYAARGETPRKAIRWRSLSPALARARLSAQALRRVELGEEHLFRRQSLVVPAQDDTDALRHEVEQFVGLLAPEVLQGIGVFTFTNATRDRLEHFGPLLAGVYHPARTETLQSVLEQFVDTDERGSRFTVIRRADGAKG